MAGKLADCGAYCAAFLFSWSFLIVCAALSEILITIKQRRPFRVIFPELLLLILCEITEKTCLYLSYTVYRGISFPLFEKITVLSAVAFLISLTAGVAGFIIRRLRWSGAHISDMSIKESFDSLPTGICFYYENGFVGFINDKMNELAVSLTGAAVSNGCKFWEMLCTGSLEMSCIPLSYGQNPVIRAEDGRIYRFMQYVEFENGRRLLEITANDITELYEKSERLRKNNEKLRERSDRLLRYSQNITEEIREREILNAKIKVHDNMNRLLLATRRCIDENGGEAERKRVFSLWHGNILMFSGENDKTSMDELIEASRLLGIETLFKGEMPEDTVYRNVITLAVAECMTNAVRHAEAKKLFVELSENKVIITNDGAVPTERISEGGGLGTVRKKIEELHGEMHIQSAPEFKLILNFPGGVDEVGLPSYLENDL